MSKTSLFGEAWKELCDAYHFNTNLEWTYRSDYRYLVDAALLADVDNTITRKPTLTDNYLAIILDRDEVKPHKPGIVSSLSFLAENPYAVKDVFDTIFLKELRGVLREDVHEDACLDAALATAPPPHTSDLMFDMRDRGVTTLVLTQGMQDALVPWYWSKINAPVYALRGTRLIFKDGLLKSYDMGGQYGKNSQASSLLNDIGMPPIKTIALSDDPVIDLTQVAVLGVGLMLWVDSDGKRRELAAEGRYAYPGKNVAVLRGVGEDRRKITEYVDKKLRSEFVTETVTPVRILALNEEFKRFESAIDYCKKDRGSFDEKVKEVTDKCGRVIALGNPFVSTITNGVEETFAKLRFGLYADRDAEDMLSWAEHIRDTLRKENPELVMRDEFITRIKKLIEEQPSQTSF